MFIWFFLVLFYPDAFAVLKPKVTHVHQHAFIKDHFLGFGKDSALLGWLVGQIIFLTKIYHSAFNLVLLDVGSYKFHIMTILHD